ncbi:NADP-dependent oxidoreductase domain-containing protein [Dipodascopsis tothii]|uniref:NADP-dependent oxidoreductase domain-containing protein n=1 Tax=Dipodascopsis tothii TaxID=44089 RepID=UPI0034CD28DB
MAFAPASKPVSQINRYRQLAPSASVRVSPLCLGAMNFGDAWKDWMGECNKEKSFAMLDFFYQQGGNFIDTANAYQSGESEMWIGDWMKERKNRNEIVLATKYSSSPLRHLSGVNQANYGGNGSKSLRLSLESSLEKLKTTYIDLFYLHWWDYTVSIPELMHTLNDLAASGKILYLGISDAPAWVVTKANQYARDHGLRQFSVYQGLWNASIRDLEREIIPMCRDEGMGLCPYGTLGQGRFRTETQYKELEVANEGRSLARLRSVEKQVSKVLEKISVRKSVPLTSIALAYIMHKTTYVFPIVGGRKPEHLAANIAALSIELSPEDIAEIEDAYNFDPGFPHTFLTATIGGDVKPRGAYNPGEVWLTGTLANYDWVQRPAPIPPIKLEE